MSLMQRDIESLRSQSMQRTYNWEVIMPTFLPTPGEMVSQLAQKVRYHDYETEAPTEIRDGAYKVFYAGDLRGPALSITFLENELAYTKMYFANWKNTALDRHGLWKKKIGGYARDIILLYYTTSGLPLREVRFVNAWPLKWYDADLDYAANNIMTVEIPFACDLVREGVVGTTGIGGRPAAMSVEKSDYEKKYGLGYSNISLGGSKGKVESGIEEITTAATVDKLSQVDVGGIGKDMPLSPGSTVGSVVERELAQSLGGVDIGAVGETAKKTLGSGVDMLSRIQNGKIMGNLLPSIGVGF
jgi:hypothetical protein